MKKFIKYFLIFLALLYASFWVSSIGSRPVEWGISFSPEYARSLGLNAGDSYMRMLNELKPNYIRLSAMWKEAEVNQGIYDFSDVGWYMDRAEEFGTKVILVIGQKAPRWPECHVPEWVDYSGNGSADEVQQSLLDYVDAAVNRFKDYPALEMWQVENEAFIKFHFGECDGYLKDAIYEEVELVRELDPETPIIVTDSGELGLWNEASKVGDYFGTTLYRIVRDPNGKTWSYGWLPAGFYRAKAMAVGVEEDRFFVSELQGEPWFAEGDPTNTSVEEMEETMDPERLRSHMKFVEHMRVPRAYLWGVEWWDFMRQNHDDERYWEIVKNKIKETR